MARAYISIGSNMGDRIENCRNAVSMISGLSEITAVSSVYETEPVGNRNQPEFINCAAEIETSLSPDELLSRLKSIEGGMGRKRGERWGPRVIDVDIIFYSKLIIDTPDLKIPHPEAHLRRFVLEPICEINPGLVHPVTGATVLELLAALDGTERVVKRAGPSTLFSQ